MDAVTGVLASVLAHRDGHMWDGDGWMWLWGSLMMLALVGVVVWLVVRFGHGGGGGGGGSGSARRILDERLARGEIDPEDYDARLDKLR